MIALLGANGSIGTRYKSILKYLNEPYIPVEVDDDIDPDTWSKAIVATPTETHFEIAEFLNQKEIPFLLEKPPTTNLEEALEMSHWDLGYIVNNYEHLQLNHWWPKEIKSISYDFFNTGRDGLAQDLCQLIYMAKRLGATFEGKAEAPTWTLYINDFKVPYEDIEASYISMITAFISDESKKLMPISHALAMLKAVHEWERK